MSDDKLCITMVDINHPHLRQIMSSLGNAMGDAIKRRIDKAGDAPVTTAVDRKTAERLASEEAQRKAYEARQKRAANGQ